MSWGIYILISGSHVSHSNKQRPLSDTHGRALIAFWRDPPQVRQGATRRDSSPDDGGGGHEVKLIHARLGAVELISLSAQHQAIHESTSLCGRT